MDFEFTDEQNSLRDAVARWVEKGFGFERRHAMAREGGAARAVWTELSGLGLTGLAVPEDFPLPEGYVRHYQATDDGQRIEPILMFSPDRPRRDASGRPLLGREERVVPPELAPPGLPLRLIVIPPADPGR